MGIRATFRLKKKLMPAKQRHNLIVNGIVKGLGRIGGQSITLRKRVIRTWTGPVPDWISRVYTTASGKGVHLRVNMVGSPFGKKKWYWLDKGTRDRYATMQKGFQAKTSYRVLGSKKGKLGVAYISTRVPRPGIDARHFNDEANKRMTPKAEEAVDKAVAQAMGRVRFSGRLL